MRASETGARLRDLIPAEFSGVVSIARPRDEVVTEAWGLAYRPDLVPNTPETRFAIASGTKGFTAMAVLALVAGGRLDPEALVADLLPGRFPGFAPAISVRHLLTHTSGIGDYCDEEEDCDFEAIWAERPVYNYTSPSDFAPLFADLPAKFAPGERFGYNNSGFIVLGMVIEAVTGRGYAEVVPELVFLPFGMEDAGYFRSDQLPKRCAMGYVPGTHGDRWRSNIFSVPVVGGADGGAYASASDMHRYWTHVLGPDADVTTRDMILETRVEVPRRGRPDAKSRGYSLGHWIADDWDERRFFYLTGGDPGVAFLSGYCPDDGRSFVILCNTEEGFAMAREPVLEIIRALG